MMQHEGWIKSRGLCVIHMAMNLLSMRVLGVAPSNEVDRGMRILEIF